MTSAYGIHVFGFILPLLAAAAGWVIGTGFGAVQETARLKHARLEKEGKFSSGWSATPGSMRRIALLLGSLALVQLLFPALFQSGALSPWLVSGGIALGYGLSLLRQLRRRMS